MKHGGRGFRINAWSVAGTGLAIGVLLQVSLLPGLMAGALKIDLVFSVMMTMAILGYMPQSFFIAILGGLALDALSGQFIGLNALSYFSAALIVSAVQGNLTKDTLITPAAAMFAGYSLKELVYLFVLVSAGLKFMPGRVAAQFAISAVLNALFGTWLYWALHFRLGLPSMVEKSF